MDATSVRPPRDRAAVDQPASSRLLKQHRSVHCDELVDHRHRFRRAIHTFCHDARRSNIQSTRVTVRGATTASTQRRDDATTQRTHAGDDSPRPRNAIAAQVSSTTVKRQLAQRGSTPREPRCAVAFCCSVPSATLRRAPSRCPRCWTLLTDEQRGYVSPRSALSQQPRKPDAPCALGSWGFRRQNQRSSSGDVRP